MVSKDIILFDINVVAVGTTSDNISSKRKTLDKCRNLPFGGRAMQGSRVRLPWEEGAQSRHQRLFEENVGKIRKV